MSLLFNALGFSDMLFAKDNSEWVNGCGGYNVQRVSGSSVILLDCIHLGLEVTYSLTV